MIYSYDRLLPYVAQSMGVSGDELASSFRPAVETDIPAILRLRHSVCGVPWWDDSAFVRWRYFGRRALDGTAPYWVVEHRGEITGACGLEPILLVVDGVELDAVRTLDIMVRPDYDGRGLGVFMNLALFQHFPVTIVTGSNNASHHLLTKLFHHTLDLVFWKDLIESRELIDERLRLGPVGGVVAAGADG